MVYKKESNLKTDKKGNLGKKKVGNTISFFM